jgi:phage tail sheath protein FI
MSYLTPGQYVEENSNVNRPIQGTAQGLAAFIGITAKGPVNVATLVTSFTDFVSKFGSYSANSYLAYAVEAFFTEAGEGAKCYVTRVVHYTDIADEETNTNVSASVNLLDVGNATTLTATSTEPELDGNAYKVSISEATIPTAEATFGLTPFKQVIITFNKAMNAATLVQGNFSSTVGGAIDTFVKDASNTFVTITFTNALAAGDTVVIGAAVADSLGNPVVLAERTLTKGATFVPKFKVDVFLTNVLLPIATLDNTTLDAIDGVTLGTVLFTKVKSTKPSLITKAPLTGGSNGLTDIGDNDYIGSVASSTGLYSLDIIDENLNIVIPGITSRAVLIAAQTYADNKKCFFIGDVPSGLTYTEARDFKLATGTYVGEAAIDSKFGALYYPWYYVKDPTANGTKLMPVSGAMAGIYSRVAGTRGVHKAPAGVVDGKLKTALGVERIITDVQQSELNPNGINVIRSFSDAGVVAWGARTTSSDTAWKYVNVRLHFNFIMSSLLKGTKWAVFEPNNESLWSKLRLFASSFLKDEYNKGAFADGGSGNPADAYYVICNNTNNTETSIDAGQVKIDIGVAENKPGEFIIFNVSQWDGGRLITE